MSTWFSEFPLVSSPVPSYRSTITENDQVSLWAGEVAASFQTRQRASRASSVISIRTKTSANSAREDAHSIDLNLDGTYFRISRDGASITTRDLAGSLPGYLQVGSANRLPDAASAAAPQVAIEPGDLFAIRSATQSSEPNIVQLAPPLQVDDSHKLDEPPQNLDNRLAAAIVNAKLSRHHSLRLGSGVMSVRRVRRFSQGDAPTSVPISWNSLKANARFCRQNGCKPPGLTTNFKNTRAVGTSEISCSRPRSASHGFSYPLPTDLVPRSDDASLISRPPSRDFIGKYAPGHFPSQPTISLDSPPPGMPDDQATIVARSPVDTEQDYADPSFPLAMETQNDVAVHYSRLIRTIDRDHRRALHEQDEEMAKLRERLNEQNIVHGQQLALRDFTIEDLRVRLAHLKTSSASEVDRATNAVEDMWERRWKDRDFHLTERMRRMEADQQVAIERAATEMDQVWKDAWANKSMLLVRRLQNVIQTSRCDLENFDADIPIT